MSVFTNILNSLTINEKLWDTYTSLFANCSKFIC